jgi:hypothetical protein
MEAWQAGNAATGRLADENEMDQIIWVALPGTGTFTLVSCPQQGPVGGKYKVNYTVS